MERCEAGIGADQLRVFPFGFLLPSFGLFLQFPEYEFGSYYRFVGTGFCFVGYPLCPYYRFPLSSTTCSGMFIWELLIPSIAPVSSTTRAGTSVCRELLIPHIASAAPGTNIVIRENRSLKKKKSACAPTTSISGCMSAYSLSFGATGPLS